MYLLALLETVLLSELGAFGSIATFMVDCIGAGMRHAFSYSCLSDP